MHPNSAALTLSFMKQGVLKQVLTEGERYVMTLFSVMTFNEQGVYDVVNNLGSLAARFLFRPVEDACYFYFSQSVKRDVAIDSQNRVGHYLICDFLEEQAIFLFIYFGMNLGRYVFAFSLAISIPRESIV